MRQTMPKMLFDIIVQHCPRQLGFFSIRGLRRYTSNETRRFPSPFRSGFGFFLIVDLKGLERGYAKNTQYYGMIFIFLL